MKFHGSDSKSVLRMLGVCYNLSDIITKAFLQHRWTFGISKISIARWKFLSEETGAGEDLFYHRPDKTSHFYVVKKGHKSVKIHFDIDT